MSDSESFSQEQQEYLQGFAAGCAALSGMGRLPTFGATLAASAPAQSPGPADARSIHAAAQERFLAEGKKLTPEEQAKRAKDPFQMWDEITANAADAKFPKGTDVFLYKYHGLFYVAPAQNSFMCRLRLAGGILTAAQFRGVAEIAERCGGGYVDVTTRANLQIREIGPQFAEDVITSLFDLGIIARGSGADNIRNVTGTPTAGIDPQELIDTRPLTKAMHHYILQHPEMYGLPRKFNIAFDGGGTISALADTNDIGFMAVRVPEGKAMPAGVYFRLELGGITGHLDFARDTGVILKPEECVSAAAAIVRAFIEHGDRTDRKKARLKYVLDRLGFEGFLAEVEKHWGRSFTRLPLDECIPRGAIVENAHLGVHAQRDDEKYYVGIGLPVGRMRADQVRDLARISERFGSGVIRLTVWQNLLIDGIAADDLPAVKRAIEEAGLAWSVTNVRSGLIACTGNGGCRFAASNTKGHALAIADYLESRIELDRPVNIHLTGCHHSCAQHYIGDIGLLATKVTVGEEMIEGYHLYVGGGYGENREIGRQFRANVPFEEIPPLIHRLLAAWLAEREGDESFRDWSRKVSLENLESAVARAVMLEEQSV